MDPPSGFIGSRSGHPPSKGTGAAAADGQPHREDDRRQRQWRRRRRGDPQGGRQNDTATPSAASSAGPGGAAAAAAADESSTVPLVMYPPRLLRRTTSSIALEEQGYNASGIPPFAMSCMMEEQRRTAGDDKLRQQKQQQQTLKQLQHHCGPDDVVRFETCCGGRDDGDVNADGRCYIADGLCRHHPRHRPAIPVVAAEDGAGGAVSHNGEATSGGASARNGPDTGTSPPLLVPPGRPRATTARTCPPTAASAKATAPGATPKKGPGERRGSLGGVEVPVETPEGGERGSGEGGTKDLRPTSLSEAALMERVVWVRLRRGGGAQCGCGGGASDGTTTTGQRGYWWPALLFESYQEIVTQAPQVWDTLPLWTRCQVAYLTIFDAGNPRNWQPVALLLGRHELVETAAEQNRRGTAASPSGRDDPAARGAKPDLADFDRELPHILLAAACNIEYFSKDPDLYYDWHRGLDQVEALVRDCTSKRSSLSGEGKDGDASMTWVRRARRAELTRWKAHERYVGCLFPIFFGPEYAEYMKQQKKEQGKGHHQKDCRHAGSRVPDRPWRYAEAKERPSPNTVASTSGKRYRLRCKDNSPSS